MVKCFKMILISEKKIELQLKRCVLLSLFPVLSRKSLKKLKSLKIGFNLYSFLQANFLKTFFHVDKKCLVIIQIA
jgi:hypothetical protein